MKSAAMNEQADPVPAADEHQTALTVIGLLQGLVNLTTDKAAQARLSQLADAHSTARVLIDQAAKARAEADEHLARVEAEIAAAREKHGDERDRHQATMREREADVAEKEARAAEHLKVAEADRAEAAKIKDTLTRKMAALQAA
jgi:hypothetical protein